MIFSSLAGCLSTDDDSEPDAGTYGTVMVSTYHVQQLVSAVAGDSLTVEIISPSNVPVHDYEPSAADLIGLQDADLFLYHGLNLEPWVESTLSSLGGDAPSAAQTHTMPSGEIDLDYGSMLISELCEHLSEGPYEASELSHDEHDASEIHAEHVAHRITLEDDHDEDGHDDHDEDGHDDHDEDGHDDHKGHEHASAERVMMNPVGCPADSVISIYHLDEGEYILEFEFETEDSVQFDMVVLKMAGGHAGHDHGAHGDEDGHDDHADEEDGHDDHDDHDDAPPAPEELLEGADTDNNSGMSFEEFTTFFGEGETLPQEIVDDFSEIFANNDVDNSSELELSELASFVTDIDEYLEAMEVGDDDHDDHMAWVCYNASTHTIVDIYDDHDCEDAGYMWVSMEMDDEEDHILGYAKLHIEVTGDYGFALPMGIEMFILMGEDAHDDHDDHSGHDDHADEEDGHDDHDEDGHEEEGHEEEGHEEEGHEEEGHDEHDEDNHEGESELVSGEDEEAFDFDPHSWLDPVAYKAQVNVVLGILIENFPEGEDTFTVNAKAYIAQLDLLHVSYDTTFSENGVCHGNSVAANHNAYAYMAERYDLEFVTVHGLDPEGEPSAEDIAEVVEHINEEGITVLFVEEYTDMSAVDSIVQETGVTIQTLYTMELPPSNADDDYVSMMQKNLDNLKSGMGC